MQELIDAGTAVGAPRVADAIATKGMGVGVATSAVGALSSNHIITILGFLLTLSSFIVNLIFKLRRDRREQELQEAKLKILQHSSVESVREEAE